MIRIATVAFAVGAMSICATIVAISNPHALLVMLPVVFLAVVLSYLSPQFVMPLIFLLVPLTGVYNIIFPIRGIPSTLIFPYACLLGLAAKNKSLFPAALPKGILLFVLGSLFSLGVAIYKLPPMDYGPLTHAWGWIAMEGLLVLSGPLIYFYWQHSPPASLYLPLVLFAPILIPAVVGATQFFGRSFVFLNPDFFNNGSPQQLNATYSDPNALALCCAMLIPLSTLLIVVRSRLIPAWLSTGALVFLLYIAGSRSSMIAVVVSMLIFLPLLMRTRLKQIALLSAVVGALAFAISFSQRNVLRQSSRVDFMLGRAELLVKGRLSWADLVKDRRLTWDAAKVVFKRNPVAGVGLGAYLIQVPTYASEIGNVINDNAGSQYLQLAAEQGAVGLLIFLFLVGSLFMEFLQSKTKPIFQWAAFASVCGLMAAFIFGAHVKSFEVTVMFWTMLAFISKSFTEAPYEHSK